MLSARSNATDRTPENISQSRPSTVPTLNTSAGRSLSTLSRDGSFTVCCAAAGAAATAATNVHNMPRVMRFHMVPSVDSAADVQSCTAIDMTQTPAAAGWLLRPLRAMSAGMLFALFASSPMHPGAVLTHASAFLRARKFLCF